MNSPDAFEGAAPARGSVFRYEGFATDAERGLLTCRYSLDGREFAERVSLAPGPGWDSPAAQAAARIVYLLAGVSYYKTAAPPVIDLGDTALTGREAAFLLEYYRSGLGEYAYRNGLDLSALHFAPPALPSDPATPATSAAPAPPPRSPGPPPHECAIDGAIATPNAHSSAQPPEAGRPLIPFGGGIDSIVTVESVRKHAGDIALFVVSRPGTGSPRSSGRPQSAGCP